MASFDPLDDQTLALAMHGELRRALDGEPARRRRLGHLALIEKMLTRDGLRAVEALPTQALERACQQLRSLPITPDEVALLQFREWLEQSLRAARLLDAPEAPELPSSRDAGRIARPSGAPSTRPGGLDVLR
jgi:hypothetical protein